MIKHFALIVLILISLCTISFGNQFEYIRSESTYWMPYEVEDVIIVMNKSFSELVHKEFIELDKAIAMCKKDRTGTPYKFFWFRLGDFEGMVTQYWPGLLGARYPADINSIMLKTRMPNFKLYKEKNKK